MQSNRIKALPAMLVLTVWALTGCTNTAKPSDTVPIKTVEVPVMPAPPAALMVPPARPAPPESGSADALLEHAVEFGGYVAELENQNAAWREWVKGVKE